MKKFLQWFLFLALFSFFSVSAEAIPPFIKITAIKISDKIFLDGKLDEPMWKTAEPVSQFTQREPNQGTMPTEKTEVWVLYDDDALYIGAKMHDTNPDSIMHVLGRKDQLSTADWFGVFIDAYRDKRSGNYFAIGPAGTLADGVLYNDDWDDDSWDGVWEAKASINADGWSAEFRIPFSQLRFKPEEKAVWGINFRRDIGRKNEQDYLVFTPRAESGFVSRFPELVGIEGVKPSNSVEILPFVTSKHERIPSKKGNPFNTEGVRNYIDAGADLKYGISSNVILDATVNPDFGQVEVDPAVVNLSDVESFFQEKRPFFIEGANTFSNFGRGGGRNFWNFNFPQPTFFYSRRIGRSPHWNEELDNADYVDAPIATKILGAGKITGKIGDGWNIGTIHAFTSREFAQYEMNGKKSEAEIEPATYFGIGRIQKEINEGREGIGILSTVTIRNFSSDAIGKNLKNNLNRSSAFIGADGWTFLDAEKAWVVTGYVGMSNVNGSKTRITNLQRNSTHYFQRPDAAHVEVDSGATSLTGFTGRAFLIKQKGNFYFNSSFGFHDPKFEINDLGFLSRANVINMHIGGGYSWTEPDGIFRRKEIGGGFGQSYDYGGNVTHNVLTLWMGGQLMNFYYTRLNLAMNPTEHYNNRRTRGGPMTMNARGYEINSFVNTDERENISAELNANASASSQSGYFGISPYIQFRPASNIIFSIGPDISRYYDKLMWIGAYNDASANATYGRRYVFAEMNQKTIAANIRLNFTFTPTLSLQLFMQPLISSGAYNNFTMLRKPKSFDYVLFGKEGSTIETKVDQQSGNINYKFDADGNGNSPVYSINNPNFTYKSLRGNAVLRWEYLPGSTLFFVWTQSRANQNAEGDLQVMNSVKEIGKTQPENIFLIKMSYYFNM